MTFVFGILGLGFLVFFHEAGHFLAARVFGVTVEAFSIGMGPVLLHYKKGNTDYRLSAIPLGGYCAMKGEKDFQKALEENLLTIEASSDSFYGIHPLKRLAIAFAGPFFNFFFGFLSFFMIALVGYTYYSAGTTVTMADEVYPQIHSAAHESGMMTGDRIVSINGKKVNDFSEIAGFVSIHPDVDLIFVVSRDGQEMPIVVHSDLDIETGSGKVGIVSDANSVIAREHERKGFAGAVKEGFSETFSIIGLTFRSILTLFKGINISNAVSGPVRITSMLGSTVKEGFSVGIRAGIISTLELLALISISLFLTNLLPVPVLDGGLILFAFVEWITRKKMSPKALYRVQLIGIAFIGMLMVIAIFGDVLYFTKR